MLWARYGLFKLIGSGTWQQNTPFKMDSRAKKILDFWFIETPAEKKFKKIENIYKVTVNFVCEMITYVKDKNNQIIEGNPDTIKTVNDVWRFAKNMWSQDPTWYLIDTSSK